MKKHQRLIPILTPFFLLVLAFHSMLIDYELSVSEPISFSSVTEETINSEPPKQTIEIKRGVWFRIDYLSHMIRELQTEELPIDTTPEESIETLKRILIGQRILFFILIFYVLLCFSAFISYLYRAWFYLPLNRGLFWFGTVWTLQQSLVHLRIGSEGQTWAWIGFVFFLTSFVLCVLSSIYIEKGKKEPQSFETLKHSSALEEEGRAPVPTSRASYLKLLVHFLVIILVGVLIGNFIYIPLFLLQKYYVTEFGIFILSLLGLLSAFYIYNYSKVGGEKQFSSLQNTLVSISYLQFRFLRNGFLGVFGLILVVFFVTFLFSLLLFNIDILQMNTSLLEKGTEF
ncbi:LIC_10230 family protein [Leptospira sp. 'Mane']|uniref:LIC_10230 family protein n=1 Tax=Leptospira sp. 'Mane' TaxID=3387407 RepID=UPI00398B1EFD